MKMHSKQRLFEVMGRLDKTFKPKLNEDYNIDVSEDSAHNDAGEPLMTHQQYRDYSEPAEPEYNNNTPDYDEEYNFNNVVRELEKRFNTIIEYYDNDGSFFTKTRDYIELHSYNGILNVTLYNQNNEKTELYNQKYDEMDFEELVKAIEPYRNIIKTGQDAEKAMDLVSAQNAADWAYASQERAATGGLGESNTKNEGYRPRSSYSNDPRWITAKYDGVSKNGERFKRGDRILYYPSNKQIYTGKEAEANWRDFESNAEDEYQISGGVYENSSNDSYSYENKNIHTNKYGIETINKPIISDAINILSKNNNSIEFTDINEFKSFLNNQKYFSASYSHVYKTIDDYNEGNSDESSILLFETGREIVAAWDNNTNVGYIIPSDKMGSKTKMYETKSLSNEINPKYTHFAVLKDGKIVNGWDYTGYDKEELREFKNNYFAQDLIDMDYRLRDVKILTAETLKKRGVNPFDLNNWEKYDNSLNEGNEVIADKLNDFITNNPEHNEIIKLRMILGNIKNNRPITGSQWKLLSDVGVR